MNDRNGSITPAEVDAASGQLEKELEAGGAQSEAPTLGPDVVAMLSAPSRNPPRPRLPRTWREWRAPWNGIG
jgi:hypothetical protein